MNMHNITLIVGKSGSGKSSIANKLEEYGYRQLPSFTTRNMRDGDVNGKDHLFISNEEFVELRRADKIGAYTLFDKHYYGATKEQIEEYDTYIIDLDGVKDLLNNMSSELNINIVYISSNPFIRLFRMKKRGDSFYKIVARLKHDKKAFKGIYGLADNIVDGNDSLDLVVSNVLEIMDERSDTIG